MVTNLSIESGFHFVVESERDVFGGAEQAKNPALHQHLLPFGDDLLEAADALVEIVEEQRGKDGVETDESFDADVGVNVENAHRRRRQVIHRALLCFTTKALMIMSYKNFLTLTLGVLLMVLT